MARGAAAVVAALVGPAAVAAALAGPAAVASTAVAPAVELAAVQAGYTGTERNAAGGLFNQEHGRLHGLQARAGAGHGPWRLGVEAAALRGTPGYAGLTQAGLPLATRTQLGWYEASARLDRGFDVAPGLQFAAGLGLQWRLIDRAIQPTASSGALTERLDLRGWHAHLAAQWQAAPAWHLSGWWRAERFTTAHLDVDAHGTFDPFGLSPADGRGRVWGLQATWQAEPAWAVNAGWSATHLRVGASAPRVVTQGGLPAGLASYPGSTQWLRAWHLGVVWRLNPA